MNKLRLLLGTLLVLLAISVAAAFTAQERCGGGCGIRPIKPIPPMGCKDLVAVCRCDSRGCNCEWEWVCVPR